MISTVQAWNIRPGNPEKQSWFSCEFVESSLIFFYGSTNIFLEHLAGWGKAWTARDLEHVAITVLFIGGGLVSSTPTADFTSSLTVCSVWYIGRIHQSQRPWRAQGPSADHACLVE